MSEAEFGRRAALKGMALSAGFGIAGAAASSTMTAPPAQAQAQSQTLRVAMTGGTFLTVHGEKYAGNVFTALTGIKVEYIAGYGTDTLARLIAEKGRRAPFDVWQAEDAEVFEGIDQGLVDKLEPNLIPHLKDVSPSANFVEGYAPAACGIVLGLIYRADKFKELGLDPTSWDVLWNPKLDGRVALAGYQVPNTQALLMVLASYLGGSEKDQSKAIDTLAKIKIHSLYKSAADLMAKMESGEVWLSYTSQARAVSLAEKGQPIGFSVPANPDKTFGYGLLAGWSPVKGSPMGEAAQRYIDLLYSPGNQLGFALESPYAPVSTAIQPVIKAHPSIIEVALAGKSFDQIKFLKWPKDVRDARKHWGEEYSRKIG